MSEWDDLGLEPADFSAVHEAEFTADLGEEDILAAMSVDLPANPIEGVPDTGSAEDDTVAELDALSEGFRARLKREEDRLGLVLDTRHWCCVVFATYEQLTAFREAMRWYRYGERYLNGVAMARDLGVDIPPTPSWPQVPAPNADYVALAMSVEENRASDRKEEADGIHEPPTPGPDQR